MKNKDFAASQCQIWQGRRRVEICRDRHDRRSCKICASCVNFSENKAISRIICVELQDLHTPSVILH